MTRARAQLVLTAAAVIAVALAPAVLAYLQLGYHPDVRASAEYDDPLANANRLLERSVHDAGANATGEYRWGERREAVAAVRDRLRPRVETLESSRVAVGTAYQVTYNESAARAWATERCPRGAGRRFGACLAIEGVVAQNRAGEAHVLGVAVDVRATTERGRYETTYRVPVVESLEESR